MPWQIGPDILSGPGRWTQWRSDTGDGLWKCSDIRVRGDHGNETGCTTHLDKCQHCNQQSKQLSVLPTLDRWRDRLAGLSHSDPEGCANLLPQSGGSRYFCLSLGILLISLSLSSAEV